jgi:hypothetical protein
VSKASIIMVAPQVNLRALPLAERQVVSHFLFDCIRGLDAKHDKRWRRLWNRIWYSEPGEAAEIAALQPRSLVFHKRHMAIEQRLFDSQERWTNLDRFRDWLKTGAGFGHYEVAGGRMRFIPASCAYEECSDDEMREFHTAMVEWLHSPYPQRRLWPHIPAAQRSAMLETVLAKPGEGEQP